MSTEPDNAVHSHDLIPSLEDETGAGEEEEAEAGALTHGTVVRLSDDEFGDEDDVDEAVQDQLAAPFAPMDVETAGPTPRKRGRPSKSASASRTGTPAAPNARPTANGLKRKAMADQAGGPSPKRAARATAQPTRPASSRAAAAEANKKSQVLGARKAAVRARERFSMLKPRPRLTAAQRAAQPVQKEKGTRGRKKKVVEQAEEDDGERWAVEAIVDDGVDRDTKVHMYLVKWEGYSQDENTWEPRQNLKGCETLISAYEKDKTKKKEPKKPRGRPKAVASK